MKTFQIKPIGRVHKDGDKTWITIAPDYQDGLLGLEQFSHIMVFYWFDQHDTPHDRGILQVHPRKNPVNPLTGVFATHAPVRPNLVAMTICELLSVVNGRLELDAIDALDASPVIDIKCYIPERLSTKKVRMPGWVNTEKNSGADVKG
ncbi:MAG: hypothetical protein VR64_02295 [Desulfatitalea sp. BRH_c12]|nr:MAG: hypothetical protein VR64_02295 [Desulfatitalea sp. BRH_c12]